VGLVASDAALLIGEPLAGERVSLAELASCHFPAAESGRAVRALMASLLL
jgi:hypothetical protein